MIATRISATPRTIIVTPGPALGEPADGRGDEPPTGTDRASDDVQPFHVE